MPVQDSIRFGLAALRFLLTKRGGESSLVLMGWPQQQARIKALGAKIGPKPVKIRNVEMLGQTGKLHWTQEDAGLTVDIPPEKPCDHAIALKVAIE
jgi:alpha-L-fucosidase